MTKKLMRLFLALSFLSILVSPAWADIKQTKIYKEAFPGEKPKCACCHVDKKPSKEDGKHDLNEYGKKVIALANEPTAENYKAAGKAPEPQE